MDESYLGAFHASPVYSGIATVAQILLRTKPFVDKLAEAYTKEPSFNLLAILLDLNAQFHEMPDDVDINPLIQEHGLAVSGSVNVTEYLSECLQFFQEVFGILSPFAKVFVSGYYTNPVLTIKVNKGESVGDALARTKKQHVTLPLANVVFFEGENLVFEEQLHGHVLYAVVCQESCGYYLYLRDEMGWLMITDSAVLGTDGFDSSDVCLVAYIAAKDMVVTHRPRLENEKCAIPSVASSTESEQTDRQVSTNNYVLWVNTLDVSRMKMDTVTHNFATKEACIREMEEITSTYKGFTKCQVMYQVDGGKLTELAPRDFQSEVALFIEDTKSSWSLLSEFLACPAQVTLEVECYNIKQIRMSAIFVSTQKGSDVYDFCKRLLEDVLLVDGSKMRVFCVNAQGIFEIERDSTLSITRISGEGSKILFSINGEDPNKAKSTKSSSETADEPVSLVDAVSRTLPGKKPTSSDLILKATLVEVDNGRLRETKLTIPWKTGITQEDIFNVARTRSVHTNFELWKVTSDGYGLEKTDRPQPDLYVYRKTSGTNSVPLVMMRASSYRLEPTGVVYRMPFDGYVYLQKASLRYFQNNIQNFLGCKVKQCGVMKKDGQKATEKDILLYTSEVKFLWAVK